jgi:phosphoglycolate phosphatase-like HAD superfamily hydrolase
MPASLDDILTAQKNGVVAINTLTQATQRGLGTATSATVTAATLVVTGKGGAPSISV